MNTPSPFVQALVTAFLLVVPDSCLPLAQAESPTGPSSSGTAAASSPKTDTVKKYLDDCQSKPPKNTSCDKLRKDAIEILKEDLLTLGSSADRSYFLSILPVFTSIEPELRIAAADAIGMIGVQDADANLIAPFTNDPVPDVRRAVSQMISRGKGNALGLLAQRTAWDRTTGLTPETVPDPGKFKLPVAPASSYLFYTSDTASGRLSYTAKNMNELTAFFKGKAKAGPIKLDEFQDNYRYQLQDELEARDRAQEEMGKRMERQLADIKPDPVNPTAYLEKVQQIQAQSAGQMTGILLDTYPPNLYGAPTVYVLEERQIGQRSYPTRYVVLYHDKALRVPGYRLSWMTVPDDAIKTAQTASLGREKEEAARKKEDEALKKREQALEDALKKKDEQERKKFKKGQADLEKELGF